MKRRVIPLLLAALIMVLPLAAADLGSGTGAHGWRRPTYAPGELLVKYRPAVQTQAADYFRQRWGVSILHTFRDIGVHHVKLPADMTVEEALGIYRNDPDVEYAEPNYYRYITATPNDTDYQSFLWGMNNTGQTICPPEGNVCSSDPCVTGTAGASINGPSAWDVSTDCTSVTVAIIDTGVDYNHPDLAGNIWSNPGEVAGDGIDNDGNGYVDDVRGWDFVDNDNAPMDPNGHGTHVAGIIAAVGDNNRGVTGVCWTANLMILRAFDAFGGATTATIIDAMEYARNYAVTNNAKVVINASYGGPDFAQFEYNEISNLNTAGILLVAATGNESANSDSTPRYPASYSLPNIIAVAATDQNDDLACFSNYGPTSVHVAAPGVNIYSAMPGRQPVFTDNFDAGIGNWTVDPPWGAFAPGYGGTGQSLSVNLVSNQVGSFSAAPTNAIDLSSKTGALLTFKLNWSVASGDALYLETSPDAINWTSLGSISGTSSGQWVDFIADMGALDETATAHFRFRLQTNNSGQADAVYIDDVEVTASAVQDSYQFLDGTSMATPHVTGLAALVWANSPTLTHLQIKERILNSVDRLPALSTTTPVFTHGRINASNSIRNMPAPPVGLSASAVSPSQINLNWANTYYGQIGFKIERKVGASGTFTQIADLPTNTTSYSDSGLTKSTTYTYRVSAYTSDNTSAYSSEVSATTPAPRSGGGGGGCFIATALVK
jgi:subtilisin family serine protease